MRTVLVFVRRFLIRRFNNEISRGSWVCEKPKVEETNILKE